MPYPELSTDLAAAQLLMPSLFPTKYKEDESYRQYICSLVEDGVGGFCVFHSDLDTCTHVLTELQAMADIPLIFSADFEHGISMRIDGGTDFPHAMALGVAHDTKLTRLVAGAVAREAHALGVHWNFAPVCDVNTNKENPIINTRAFGESIGEVIPQATAWIEGSQEEGVAACAKHFPGHGDCAVDSHLALPTLQLSRERLSSVELVPFLAAIRAGVQSVMVAHLAVPAFDSSGIPASMSAPIISGVLREYMKFEGVIVSDALDMKAISDQYTSDVAVLTFIRVGGDCALVPADARLALDRLKQAALSGELAIERIRESCARMLALKEWCGLLDKRRHRQPHISLEEHGMLALKAATNAVRVSGDESVLPIEKYNHIACFALLSNDDIDPASEFFHYLSQVYEKDTDIAYLNADIDDESIASYIRDTESADCVLFAVFARPRSYAGTVGLDKRLVHAVQRLRGDRPTIAILFGNPYLAEELECDVTVRCYSDAKPSRGAACLALSGKSLSL